MEPIYHTATDQRVEQSEAERAFMARLLAAGVPVVGSVKLGNNWVFDGAINGTKILVEYHGRYWHERPEVKQRDARKLAWASQEGYLIVTVWEDHEQADPDGEVARVVTIYEEMRAWQVRSLAAEAAKVAKVGADRPRRRDYGDWRDDFLEGLGRQGIILDGCETAGVSREIVRRHRREDPAFDERVKDVLRDAADQLRRRYVERAEQQSDRAMEYMLSRIDPDEGATSLLTLILPYLDMSKLSHEQVDQLAQIATAEELIRVLLLGGAPAPGEG